MSRLSLVPPTPLDHAITAARLRTETINQECDIMMYWTSHSTGMSVTVTDGDEGAMRILLWGQLKQAPFPTVLFRFTEAEILRTFNITHSLYKDIP